MSGELVRATALRRCALYRHFDEFDNLLYVGISETPVDRTNTHASRSEWVEYATRAEIQWYDTRELAARAERIAIETELPIFNRQFAEGDAEARIAEYERQRQVAVLEAIVTRYERALAALIERLPPDVVAAGEDAAHQIYEYEGRSMDRAFRAHLLGSLVFEIERRWCRFDDDARAEAYTHIIKVAGESLKPIVERREAIQRLSEAPF